MTESEGASRDDTADAAAVHEALTAPDGESELDAVDEGDVGIEVSGITSHQVRCGSTVADMSSFRPRFTDQYLVRVALFDAQGRRVYLGRFVDKGTANAYKTLLHTEYVRDPQHLTHRALVIWKAVNAGTFESSWKTC
jgi:hypothetical protein